MKSAYHLSRSNGAPQIKQHKFNPLARGRSRVARAFVLCVVSTIKQTPLTAAQKASGRMQFAVEWKLIGAAQRATKITHNG
jgi:hypothetical protein